MLTLLWKNFCWNDCNTKIKQKLFINDHVSVNYVTYTHMENYMLLATRKRMLWTHAPTYSTALMTTYLAALFTLAVLTSPVNPVVTHRRVLSTNAAS